MTGRISVQDSSGMAAGLNCRLGAGPRGMLMIQAHA
jgi:hypothetical protein